MSTCFSASSTYKIFLFKKKFKISIFGGVSKFFKLIVFGRILEKFGNFGQIQLQVSDSYPHLKGKWKMS
jgi:hypothetical protein